MLSALRKTAQKVSANESSENTVRQKGHELNNQAGDWKEKVDDEITAGSNYWKNHQERYQFVKNRTYYSTRKALREANVKQGLVLGAPRYQLKEQSALLRYLKNKYKF